MIGSGFVRRNSIHPFASQAVNREILIMQVSMEPRWVTRTLRLFPHPVFAICIAIACLLVTAIFLLGAVMDGKWLWGLVALAFGEGAYLILAALVVRRRRNRFVRQGNSDLLQPGEVLKSSIHPIGIAQQDSSRLPPPRPPDQVDLRGLPPVRTLHLLIYFVTILVWEAHVAVILLRTFGVFQVPGTWRFVLTVISIAITLFTFKVGRSDINRLKKSSGKIELTGIQVAFVTSILLSISVTFVIVHAIITGKG